MRKGQVGSLSLHESGELDVLAGLVHGIFFTDGRDALIQIRESDIQHFSAPLGGARIGAGRSSLRVMVASRTRVTIPGRRAEDVTVNALLE